MDQNMIRFILIPLIIIALTFIVRKVRNKLAKPTYTNNIQTPGKFEKIILWIIRIIALLAALIALLGFVAGETEMGLVFLGLTFLMGTSAWLVKREYNMTYQENEEYFILKSKGKVKKVYYNEIIDWVPGYNEILLYNKRDKKPIRVNVSIFQPEILLGYIAKKTATGHFQMPNEVNPEDPNRIKELAYFLKSYGYTSIVETDLQ